MRIRVNVGQRIRLTYGHSPVTKPLEGVAGTVVAGDMSDDDVLTFYIAWDDGTESNIVAGLDKWLILPEGGK